MIAPHNSARRLAPIAEAADYIGANPRTIRRYIASGRLTGYRVGPRLIRVDLNEVDALLRPIPAVSALQRSKPAPDGCPRRVQRSAWQLGLIRLYGLSRLAPCYAPKCAAGPRPLSTSSHLRPSLSGRAASVAATLWRCPGRWPAHTGRSAGVARQWPNSTPAATRWGAFWAVWRAVWQS